jgi:imidazolonepropionase-like amidohydrolase
MSALERRQFLALGACLLGAPSLAAQPRHAAAGERRLTIHGGKLLRPGKPALENALITITGDRITGVGNASGAPAAGGDVIDARSKIVTYGFTDLMTGIGLVEVDMEPTSRNDSETDSDPIRAAFLAADGYDPASTVIPVTRMGGVTSVGVVPRGGMVSGQSAWADLDGKSAREAIVLKKMALHVLIDGATRDGPAESVGTSLLRVRELFDDARSFQKNPGAYEHRQVRELSASRLDLVAVSEALSGKLRVVFHVDRAADIESVLALAKENKLVAVLASCAEGWKVAGEIAAAKVPVITYPLDNLPRTFAALGARDENSALMAKAGVSVVIASGETHNARKLAQIAGNAVRAGLDYDLALDAVTRAPASAVGLGARYGSVEPGYVGNVVVWSGDPFELSTRPLAVVIHGRSVPLRSRQTRLFERYKKRRRYLRVPSKR